MHAILGAIVVVLAGGVILFSRGKSKARLPLPPGPKGWPFVGNLLQMPKNRPWLWFQQLGQQYNSDIISVNLAGNQLIILNNIEDAHELLDKRSAKYSSRPHMVFGFDYISAGRRIVLMPYGPKWRTHRSAIHLMMNRQAALAYRPTQILETKILMGDLLTDAGDFYWHIRQVK